jgi:capsular exopolysaccharide synthesis family protein
MALYSRAKTERTMANGSISDTLVTTLAPSSGAAEAYRYMRTNLQSTLAGTPAKVIVITSPGSAEGKSSVCANLGVVLAQSGKKTLVLDGDLRNPAMHEIFGLHNSYGIMDILLGERKLEEVQEEPLQSLSGLKVLPVGSPPPDPAEVLGSARFSQLLADARESFDYVLVDSSPTNLVSDTITLAAKADGVLLVLDAQRSRKGDVWEAVRYLAAVGADIIGTVMNNAKGIPDHGSH